MNTYVVTLFIFGAIVLLTTWLQLGRKRMPLPLPMCYIDRHASGLVAVHISTWFNHLENIGWAEHLAELVVIVALMGAGLEVAKSAVR